jgi:hypothetical protein
MRRLVKFLHSMGAIGLMGSMASLMVLMHEVPPTSALAGYALIYGAMAKIVGWIFLPSLALTLMPGLLAIGITPAFHNAGWAWAKLATGVLVFEGCLVDIVGPIQEEARRSASALAGHLDPSTLAGAASGVRGSLWVMMVVATANVVLAIWRPRFTSLRD